MNLQSPRVDVPLQSGRSHQPATGFRFDASGAGAPGPAVLLIHGLTGTPNEMRLLGRALSRAGFTVRGVRLAGHCGTEGDLLKTGWRDWYASVEAAHAELTARHGPIFVAGLCMGAQLALHLAYNHPDTVKGIGLYSLSFWYDGWKIPRLAVLLPFLLRTPIGRGYRFVATDPYGIKDERLRASVVAGKMRGDSAAAGLLGITGRTLRQMHEFIDVLKPELPAIATPALIVHSTEDDITSLRNPRYAARRLAGPVKTVLLDDCYHMITVDRQHKVVSRETVAFFRALAT